jgi:hypothetical protein
MEVRMSNPPSLCHTGEGYEYVRCRANGADDTVYIHRLLYVAEHGLDALPAHYEVHHRDSVPWLNVPDNLVAVEPEEHSRHHLHDDSLAPSP